MMYLSSTIGVTFQPTRPVRGETRGRAAAGSDGSISIHSPRAGRDWLVEREHYTIFSISIHSPRVGRDVVLQYSCSRYHNFNPLARTERDRSTC